ncbi:ectopic P granules protein 5 homolog isoform X2 [Mercenaria mercenaria]|uniref:ectopic P granules protein 5 homolog isoform X2 n=1 Tax=Mercenaria mercenaria TaxID=6596 RepID=UPI00234F64FC|nr:ectopic P granules protein 5 homolog isoform X2 [Mercenaria mercenaria]
MAEAVRVKRRSKEKKKYEQTSEHIESEVDLAEGIPDVADLENLLKVETESKDNDKDADEKNKKGDDSKDETDVDVKPALQQDEKTETENRTENKSEQNVDENDSKQEQASERQVENIDEGNKDEKQDENSRTETGVETKTNIVEPLKTEEDAGIPVDLEVQNELVANKVGQKSDNKVEHATQEHLYPDLSEQLQQFMLENELTTSQTVDSVPILEASFHDLKEQASTDNECVPKIEVKSSAPMELDLHPREIEHVAPPRVERREEFQPLTPEQLNSLYYNTRLENNTAYIDRFVQMEMKRENHEFYEILMSYQRARKHLLQCEAALKSYEESYRKSHDEVWITEMKTQSVKGVCGDQSSCVGTHSYNQAKLDYNALSRMTLNLRNIQDQIHNELALHSYSAQLSKLQVESYIHNLFITSPVLRDIPKNLPVFACERQNPNAIHQIQKLQDCISILFTFHRLPIDDKEMVVNLQHWTERMVSALLRVGTFEDHMYILNQIMRCPAGIGSWASHFVQTPPIPTNENFMPLMFGNTYLDHVITGLSTVLIPTSYRSEFMCKMQKMLATGKDNKNLSWVMVDSDGEEDEDPQSSWVYLHENDVVAVLKQLPLAAIFRHIFFIVQSQAGDCYEYDIKKTTDSTMYRVFAFCTCLIRILGNGLKTYNMARYRQLNKRLGRMIRQCVQFVSEHWENFNEANQGVLPALALHKLQVEYDAFFMRAVNFIHMSQRLGSWQFIADMPFGKISKDTMWKILWLLHQGHGRSFEINEIPSAQECINFVKDPSCRSQLADILQRVPASEGIYLLNTMTNMTESCSSSDISFIETVTMAVFEVSYICPETRDVCSKMGRELLSAVITCHPFMLSVLTQRVHEYMEKLGQMGLYLYKGINMETWLPTDPDLVIIRHWLLNTAVGSPANLMAQEILSNINWGNSSRGDRLMVPWRVHKQVAVLVVEAYQKFIFGKHLGSMIMEGVKQMSAAVQQYMTLEQEFNTWCWDLLLKLSLHRGSLPQSDRRLEASLGEAPDVNSDDSLLPLCKGIKEKNPTACYVTLMLTKYGHSVGDIISDGVPLLQVLSEQGLFKPTVSAIYYILPLFVDSQKYIVDSIKFQEVLLAILQADESYFRVVKGLLSYDFPGPITKLFISMMQCQIEEAYKTARDGMTLTIGLWTRLLMKIPKWYHDSNCCCILDELIKAAFTYQSAVEHLQDIFKESYREYCHHERSHGVVSSIVNWVTSGVTLPTFLDKSSCPDFSWLTYIILWLEGSFEIDSKLWSTLQEEMLNNQKAGIETCLKKSVTKLKLDQAPTWARLNIYRWAQQALDMPIGHPVAALTWQRFFVLFLGRLSTTQTSLPQRASVGERFFTGFFTGVGYSGMLKKMKKQLGKTADHYTKKSGEDNEDEEDGQTSRKELYYKLARLYNTLQLWVEEPLLHDGTLYLPSLPPQYQADRLLAIFQNQTTPWTEFLDLPEVKSSLKSQVADWLQSSTPEQNPRSKEPKDSKKTALTAKERILFRLSRCDEPLPPPPIHPIKAPVPEISPMIMEEKGAILHLLESDLNMLKEHAGQFCTRLQHHKALDDAFIDFVPALYKNIRQQVTISLKCTSMINPLHRCTKPGAVTVWVEEKWNDPIKQRQANENRAEYKQVMIECKLPPAQNTVICAVHTENAITMLVKLYRSSTDHRRSQTLNSIACSLFLHLSDTITPSILKYPPTKQFFSSCIDILGKEFIQSDPQQTEAVLQMALNRSVIGGMLAPHFKPNLSPALFVKMYGELVGVLQEDSRDQKGMKRLGKKDPKVDLETLSMLLTKFEIRKWLEEYNPSKQEVKKLAEYLSQAFMACGTDPKDGYAMVFKIYRSHEKTLLRHKFPLYLHEVLAALLQGSSMQRVCVECWEVLHDNCFHGNQTEQTPEKTFQEVSTNLSIEEIRNILAWLGHEFMQMRLNQKEATTFGMYPKWQRYVPYLAAFMRDLSKCLVDKMLPNLADAPNNEGIELVWQSVQESFAPWLQTVVTKKVVSQPWIAGDRDSASHMVKALAHFVAFAHHKTEDIRGRFYSDFLSLSWLHFATVLCKPDVSADVVSVFNMEFVQLPWKQLLPNIHIMETMAGLKEQGCSLGFNLVADIVAVINWQQVSKWYESYFDLNHQVRYEGCLYILLIQAFTENKHVENPDIQQLLLQAQTFKWKHLSPDHYKNAGSWFLQSGDPKCLLHGRTSPEALGLRLLESASGFTTEISMIWSEAWRIKRLSYLHCVSSLICQCTYLPDWDTTQLSTFIINLLTETETVESAVQDPHTRLEESTDMMKEILSLLNNSNPEHQGSEIILKTILEWLQGSPKTILLSPCIHAASRNLASLTYMVQIVEQCIHLSFVSDGHMHQSGDPWNSVLAAVQIPELNVTEFFQTCQQESSYLLLYCYVIQRIPLCQSLPEEQGVIELVLDWTEHAKPSLENESKLLLWWHKVLELILRQIDYGRDSASCVTLLKKLIHKIQGFGEDRASAGLLGAIGFGKKSMLSEKFRVCSRAVVAFCSSQVVSDDKLRLLPTDPTSTLSTAKQDIGYLLSIKTNKKYQPIKTEVDMACDFVTNQSKCLRDVLDLLKLLKGRFYADKEYLSVI